MNRITHGMRLALVQAMEKISEGNVHIVSCKEIELNCPQQEKNIHVYNRL